ncbi:MAG: multidrug transporter [Candidatus Zixiibacteriota bacterium]|nr:MAG: multidrug transporter [candidate division Zixibacteria bacterium]
MDEVKVEKIVIIATHGGEDPERASLPFVLANASLAMDTHAVVILQGTAVTLAKKGCYEHVFAAGLPPLKDLVDSFIELGGTLLICSPCIQERHITPDMLVETVRPIKAARVVMELLEASATLSY